MPNGAPHEQNGSSGAGQPLRPKGGVRARLQRDPNRDADPPPSADPPAPAPIAPPSAADLLAALTTATERAREAVQDLTTAAERAAAVARELTALDRSAANTLQWTKHERDELTTQAQVATEAVQHATAALARTGQETSAVLNDRTRELSTEAYRVAELVRRGRTGRRVWVLTTLAVALLGGIGGGLIAR